jgi:hypothetical protein
MGSWHVAAIVAPYCYAPPLYHELYALKFNGARALGRALGLLLAAELDARGVRADLLVPVPLHAARLRARGYNQAAEIARTVSVELDIPLRVRGIRRRNPTTAQSTLRRAQRARTSPVRSPCRGATRECASRSSTTSSRPAQPSTPWRRQCPARMPSSLGRSRVHPSTEPPHGAASPRARAHARNR